MAQEFGFIEIVTERPHEEVWKYLRFFLDDHFTKDRIQQVQNPPPANVEKQAQQIGYCIQQASEYFQAAGQAGLATKPLLQYYGACSLSYALILLKQDDQHSLDNLRKNRIHQRHGLELGRPKVGLLSEADLKAPQALFTKLESKLHPPSNPSGTFILFYRSVEPPVFHYQCKELYQAESAGLTGYPTRRCAAKLDEAILRGFAFSTLDLIATLPDMFFDLMHYDISPRLCRGSIQREITETSFPQRIDDVSFFIDGVSEVEKDRLRKYYDGKNQHIKWGRDLGETIHFTLCRVDGSGCPEDCYWPDIVEDISGRKFYILHPEEYILEPVAYLAILFNLGMLARYYPDIWVGAISSVRVANLVSSLLNYAQRKFPNLILDQLTYVQHYFHS